MPLVMRRAAQAIAVLAMAAAAAVIGPAAAQAGGSTDCLFEPPTSDPQLRDTMTICASIDTYYVNGARKAESNGSVQIGSWWNTSATACKITVRLELARDTGGYWTGGRKTSSCDYALDHRNTRVWGPTVSTLTTATKALTWTCIDLYFNSTSSGWQRCEYSHVVYW